MPSATLRIEPLQPVIGARVTGLDLSRPLALETVEALREAWRKYLVLVLPEQPISDAEQIAFTRQFGELEFLLQTTDRHEEHPEIFRVTNVDSRGQLLPAAGSRLGRAQNWHTDSSFLEIPCMGAVLHGIEVPPEGGDTCFANLFAVYEAMPEAMRNRLEGMTARYQFTFIQHEKGKAIDATEPVSHPLVRRHPDGRRSLYLSPAHLESIVGLNPEETQAFVNEVFSFASQPEFVYCHQWQRNDLVMWDNRATAHRVRPFAQERYPRTMHRTTLRGSEPVVS